ncbi:MAG: outer membrane protein [Crocinitomicaceae bacterium]|jgi:outer membrane protein
MKYAVVSTLLIALLASCGGDGEDKKEETKEDTTAKVQPRKTGELKIAYYINDSLVANFEALRAVDSVFLIKQQQFEGEVKGRENDYNSWIQQKENKAKQGLLTENEIAQLSQEAQTRQAQMAQFQQSRGTELQQKYAKEMEVLTKKIDQFSTEYCTANNIDILLKHGLGGQVGYAHPSMDVTMEFVAYLNQAQEKLISGK